MADKDITDRIYETLAEKGLKKGDFYRYSGIRSQSLKDWKKRGSIPAADTAIKMAEFLKVSVKWLILGEDDGELSNEELSLLSIIRQLDSRDKNDILAIAQVKLENAKKTDTGSKSSAVNA